MRAGGPKKVISITMCTIFYIVFFGALPKSQSSFFASPSSSMPSHGRNNLRKSDWRKYGSELLGVQDACTILWDWLR